MSESAIGGSAGAVLGPSGAARAAGPGRPGRKGQDDSGVLPAVDRGDRHGLQSEVEPRPGDELRPGRRRRDAARPAEKGAVILVEGSGRVARWKHTLYDWLKVSKVELAVMAELLLRGPQTEGELRARASRMEPLADLPALADDPRGPGAAGPGAVSVAARPEAGRVRGARALSRRRARAGSPGVCEPARGRRRDAGAAVDAPASISRRRRSHPPGRPRSPRSAPRSISCGELSRLWRTRSAS